MEICLEIILDCFLVAEVQFAISCVAAQSFGQRDGASNDEIVPLGRIGGRVEDGVHADQIGVRGPASGVGFEVAQEDEDEKGRAERVLRDTKIGDPFSVSIAGGVFID